MITIPGIIAFGGIYIFVGSDQANVSAHPHVWGIQIVTIAYGVLVVAPVVIGLGVRHRRAVRVRGHPALVMSITDLSAAATAGCPARRSPADGSTDVLLTFSLSARLRRVEAAAPLAETCNPGATPIAVMAPSSSAASSTVGSYALVIAFGWAHGAALTRIRSTLRPGFIPFVALAHLIS